MNIRSIKRLFLRILSKFRKKEWMITDDLVRFSVGIENVEDIINDLRQALENV